MSADGIATLLSKAAERLRAAGVESPRAEARLLLAYVLGVGQEDIVTGQAPAPTPQILARFETVLLRRIAREPLAYILESREFWSLDFAVGPGVLIPRPESEILIEEALRRFPARDAALRAGDLGTGSGCLLLAFLSERPNAEGIGSDISQDALAFAARNAKALGLENRTQFVRGDWAEKFFGAFDAIFINPPYIGKRELDGLEPEIARYEPRIALDGGPDGLDAYRRIAAGLSGYLSPQGLAFFEIGQGQAESVGALLAEKGLTTYGTVCDLAGIPRCLVAGVVPSKITPKKELALETRSG
jgi:release factor glutamine methyltransferase